VKRLRPDNYTPCTSRSPPPPPSQPLPSTKETLAKLHHSLREQNTKVRQAAWRKCRHPQHPEVHRHIEDDRDGLHALIDLAYPVLTRSHPHKRIVRETCTTPASASTPCLTSRLQIRWCEDFSSSSPGKTESLVQQSGISIVPQRDTWLSRGGMLVNMRLKVIGKQACTIL
jgi:hypothetical protein